MDRVDPGRLRTVVVAAAVAGALAGVLAAIFLTIAGEPALEEAIKLEEAGAADTGAGEEHTAVGDAHPTEVSRAVQKGPGLFGAYVVAGAGFGVLLALGFALLARYVADAFRRALVAGAVLGTSFTLLPWLKYPPNPPGVGDPETLGDRQRIYVLLIVLALAALTGGLALARALLRRGWATPSRTMAVTAGVGTALLVVLAVLPGAPDAVDAPATLVWRFRVASLGGNAVLWVALSLAVAALVSRRSHDRHDAPVPVA